MGVASDASSRLPAEASAPGGASVGFLRRHPTLAFGGAVLGLIVSAAVLAPAFAGDPSTMNPLHRLRPPSAEAWLGTDHLGRDVFARMVYGARVSLLVGLSVAMAAVAVGAAVGLVSGYFRAADAVVSRLMDGFMAIPAILLAIAMVAMLGSSVWILIMAIAIPEVPRVVRLVRSVVLSVREAPYVEAAQVGGTRLRVILTRHILPAAVAPLIVQATYVCAAAIIVESALSFLGAGVSSETATWGGMIAESRGFLPRAPWTVFAPGVALAVVVLSVNLVGDGLRDLLDPRAARRA
jgi:peptide/nickel transport system permease protein